MAIRGWRLMICDAFGLLFVLLAIFLSAEPAKAEENIYSIPNFAKVTSNIWRGAQPSDKQVRELAASGVKTIVDLRKDGYEPAHDARLAQKLGVKLVRIPIGYVFEPDDQQVRKFLSTLTNPANQPVYVHCWQGEDRTGAMIAVYRQVVENWSFADAYKEMRYYHFHPFYVFLKEFVADFSGDTKIGDRRLPIMAFAGDLQEQPLGKLDAPQMVASSD